MNKREETINKIVNTYFEEPEKNLKEVFGEYAEDLDESEREQFFKTLKEIINFNRLVAPSVEL